MVAGGSDGSRGTRRGQGRPQRRPRTGRPALGARIAATLLGLGGCVLAGLAGATGAGPLAAGDAAAGQAAVVSATPAAEAAHPLTRDRVDAWLDGLVPQLMARGDLAGAVVTVVADGQVLTERGFGHADVAEGVVVDPQTTLFRPGSVSKLFVWTAVMQLVEQGKLDLDTDINTWLDFRVPARGAPITLRQVMTHTTGLEERLRHLIVLGPDHPSSADNFRKDFVPAQIFAPGTRPAYSNYATGIAEYIVERVSGLPFEAYAEQHIFEPLGMRHASFRQQLPESLLPYVSKGYRLGSGKAWPAEKVVSPGVGGLYVSGAAMSRFMLGYLGGGELEGRRFLGAQTVATMQAPQRVVLESLVPMALGWMTSDVHGYRVVSHGGTSLFFYSWTYLLPEQGIGLFVSTNSAGRDGAGATLRAQVFERFVEAFLPPRPLPDDGDGVDAATAREHAQALAAIEWRSTRRSQSSFLRLLDLISPTRVRAHDDGTLSVDGLKGVDGAPLRWREIAPWQWREVNGRARLAAKVEDGRVVYFSADPLASIAGYEPVPALRGPGWLRPALLAAVVVLLATVVLRVGGIATRRYYRTRSAPARGGLRWTQNAAVVAWWLSLAGWLFFVQSSGAPGALLDPSIAGLWTMRLLTWLALAASVALLLVAARQPASWPRATRAWSWLLAAAGGALAWTALAHGLASFSMHY